MVILGQPLNAKPFAKDVLGIGVASLKEQRVLAACCWHDGDIGCHVSIDERFRTAANEATAP